MATPAWFEEDYYLNQKLAQLAAQDPANWKGKTTNDVKAAFDEAGFTPYTHFEAFGNSVDENISPTSQFDINFYLAAKSLELNDRVYQGKSDWTPEKVMQAFKDAGITAWDHYQQFGFMEDIAPNENFDSGKYFLAKVAELNSTNYEGRNDWTVAEVKQAFKDAGLTPVQHYAEYGKAENVDSYATGNANFKTVDNAEEIKKVVEDSGYDASTGVKDYTLAEAMAAQADNTLSKVYNLTDVDAGEVTVAQQAEITKLMDGASNSADLTEDPTYILNDTYANLQNAPASVLKFSGDTNGDDQKVIITDSIDAKGLISTVSNTEGQINVDILGANLGLTLDGTGDDVELHLTGTKAGEVISVGKMLAETATNGNNSDITYASTIVSRGVTVTMAAGGDGADYIAGYNGNDILFAGNITEKDANGLYAESQQSAFAATTKAPDGFLKAFVKGTTADGKLGDAQWIDEKIVDKYFTGHNILDGRGGENDLVASNQADTFLIQLGGVKGNATPSSGVTQELPGQNTIHQFNVGQDYLFVMDQSDRDWTGSSGQEKGGDTLTFSGGWKKADMDQAETDNKIILKWTGENTLQVTLTKDFFDAQEGAIAAPSTWADAPSAITITLMGIQNGSTATTAADLFGITA